MDLAFILRNKTKQKQTKFGGKGEEKKEVTNLTIFIQQFPLSCIYCVQFCFKSVKSTYKCNKTTKRGDAFNTCLFWRSCPTVNKSTENKSSSQKFLLQNDYPQKRNLSLKTFFNNNNHSDVKLLVV